MQDVAKGEPRVVQTGPLPVYFVTEMFALDLTAEYVSMTFCVDQHWGGLAKPECELCFRMVMPRSRFDAIRAKVARRVDGGARGDH